MGLVVLYLQLGFRAVQGLGGEEEFENGARRFRSEGSRRALWGFVGFGVSGF